MQQGMTNYKKPGYDGVTETWNILQNDFKCCGVESYTDWKEVDFGVTGDVPDDCCLNPHTDCGEGKADMDEQRAKEFIYVKGCIAKLESEIAGNSDVAIAIGAAVAIFIIINIVVSCKIAKNIRGHSISA